MKKSVSLLVLVSSLCLVACQSQNLDSTSHGSSSSQITVSDIGVKKAKQIALDDLGYNEKSVTNLLTEEGLDDGRKVYEIDFVADGKRFSYDIDAETGQILQRGSDVSEGLVETDITEGQVKEIVLSDMGVTEEKVTSLRMSQDEENGQVVYEVTVIYENSEYDYVVDSQSGKILDKEIETKD